MRQDSNVRLGVGTISLSHNKYLESYISKNTFQKQRLITLGWMLLWITGQLLHFLVYFHLFFRHNYKHMPYVWIMGHSSIYFRCLCFPHIVSAPGHTFLSLLLWWALNFSCKAQLKKHILYVVSHEYWFITRYINFSLISAHITSILSPLVWQLSVHILSSPTGLWSSENRDLSMFIFLFEAFSTVSSLAHWTSSDVCYLKESKWINKR